MSNVDVVQRTAAALPSPFESAMAAAATATATTTTVTAPTNTGTPASLVTMAATKPTTISSSTSLGTATSATATTTAPATTNNITNNILNTIPQIGVIGIKRTRNGDHKEGRISKSRQRTFPKSMEPPVLSFYGTQPVPLPSRFGSLKKRLVAGHESALQASWGRLLDALRDEVKHIEQEGSGLIPSLDFTDIDDAAKVEPFGAQLKRYGIGVIRGVVPSADASRWVEETKKYLETKHEYKPPPAQDPTCFDFFWTPAQVRSRAHPHVLQAQRFAMSLWNTNNDDRLATRFPITYADRIRIESVSNGHLTVNGAAQPTHEDSLIAAAAAASSAQIAQVDNGSLERWEQDGYGRGGLYDAIFKGDWESYDAWDPAGRINATSDLYNGAGACSMMRLFQGILALTVVEPGMIRLLPSPKLSTAYFLLRPFFVPKEGPPEQGAGSEEWDAYLDASNWTLEKEQSTVIHGAVPGHAQRVTAAWHPHLQLDKSLVTPPTLQAGDYIIWHPDQPYQFSNTNYRSNSRPQTSSSSGGGGPAPPDMTSMLVYTPAAPLTQTNALFLARQRKAFLRGHPGPDFDSTGTGLGSEAPHTGRLGEKDIREVGGEEGLQAMGLAPWNLSAASTSSSSSIRHHHHHHKHAHSSSSSSSKGKKDAAAAAAAASADSMDVDAAPLSRSSSRDSRSSSTSSSTHAEAEVVRLANIILFPDRYDFYMPTRASSPVPSSRDRNEKERERERERERDRSNKERENKDRDKDRDKGRIEINKSTKVSSSSLSS